jgi:hypothetical protein
MLSALLLLLFPIIRTTRYQQKGLPLSGIHEVLLREPLKTSVYDFFDIKVSLKNTGGVPVQTSAASINWDASLGDASRNVETFTLYIDESAHRYRVPIGQNKRWVQESVRSFSVEIKDIEGIQVHIEEVSLKRRLPPAIDVHLNIWAADLLGTRSIAPFAVPAYVLLLYGMIAGSLYYKRFKPAAFGFRTFASFLVLITLFSFSIYFLRKQFMAVKSHSISAKESVKDHGIQNTYFGFLDFRKFLGWIGENIETEQDILFLVRGTPVYIMSEAAYGLYPRKLEFINISRSTAEIFEDIERFKEYRYIIAMTSEDVMRIRNVEGIEIIARYREDAGFVIRIER